MSVGTKCLSYLRSVLPLILATTLFGVTVEAQSVAPDPGKIVDYFDHRGNQLGRNVAFDPWAGHYVVASFDNTPFERLQLHKSTSLGVVENVRAVSNPINAIAPDGNFADVVPSVDGIGVAVNTSNLFAAPTAVVTRFNRDGADDVDWRVSLTSIEASVPPTLVAMKLTRGNDYAVLGTLPPEPDSELGRIFLASIAATTGALNWAFTYEPDRKVEPAGLEVRGTNLFVTMRTEIDEEGGELFGVSVLRVRASDGGFPIARRYTTIRAFSSTVPILTVDDSIIVVGSSDHFHPMSNPTTYGPPSLTVTAIDPGSLGETGTAWYEADSLGLEDIHSAVAIQPFGQPLLTIGLHRQVGTFGSISHTLTSNICMLTRMQCFITPTGSIGGRITELGNNVFGTALHPVPDSVRFRFHGLAASKSTIAAYGTRPSAFLRIAHSDHVGRFSPCRGNRPVENAGFTNDVEAIGLPIARSFAPLILQSIVVESATPDAVNAGVPVCQ